MSAKRRKQRLPAADQATHAAYHQFAGALIDARKSAEAKARSEGRSVEVDITQAIAILNANPKLIRYLDGVREREDARAVALGQEPSYTSGYAVPGVPGFLPDLQRSAPTASNPRDQGYGYWGTSGKNQPQGVANARLLREWADTNEWVRSAINVRRIQIGRADILVTPSDEKKPYNKAVMKEVQQLLDQPNELRDSYRSLIEPVIEDILVLDRGVISKNMTTARKPVAIYAEDGSTIKIYPAWSGEEEEPRYLFTAPDGERKVPLRNDECIVIMANPATYRFGRSPVEVLANTIRADLKATASASNMVENKPPPHLVQIPGTSTVTLNKMREYYEHEVMGNKELFFMGGAQPAHVFPLVFSARDNQWMEWQTYLARKIATVFQISPQQLGLTFDINRATAVQQQEIFEDTGLIPLLLLLEEYLNRELLADFSKRRSGWRVDLDELNLRIVYPEVSEAARQMHAEKALEMAVKGLAGMPSMTLNQVLSMRGEEPVSGGNTFWMPIGQSVIPVASYDGDLGVYADVMIGEQDPAGGTQVMDPPKPQNEKPGKRRVPEPAESAPAADTSGNGDAPAFNDSKNYDLRRPGKHWSPRAIGQR